MIIKINYQKFFLKKDMNILRLLSARRKKYIFNFSYMKKKSKRLQKNLKLFLNLKTHIK